MSFCSVAGSLSKPMRNRLVTALLPYQSVIILILNWILNRKIYWFRILPRWSVWGRKGEKERGKEEEEWERGKEGEVSGKRGGERREGDVY